MIPRADLLKSPEYWFDEAQNELFRQVTDYMAQEGINQSELAEKLQVTKGYVSQILKGEFNYTLKKLIELSLAIGKVPQIKYNPLGEIIANDMNVKFFPFLVNAQPKASLSSATGSTSSELDNAPYYPSTRQAA